MLTNAFSLNMIEPGLSGQAEFHPVSEEEARMHVQAHGSAIGHADLAAVLTRVLKTEVACNRTTITLKDGATMVVAQYHGPRLPEGCTELPTGAKVVFYAVTVHCTQ